MDRKKLLSIGELSKLKGVSIKSLRYYDRIGVLKPAFVNPETNYRYYTPEQIIVLDIIQLCLTFGLPLKSLAQSNADGAISPNLRQIILSGQAEARKKLLEAEKMLLLSDDILEQIDRLDAPHPERQSYCQHFGPRAVLTVPCEMACETGSTYLSQIAALYQAAREDGLTVLSQQGLLFDHVEGRQYIFLAVVPKNCTAAGYRALPAADYTCMTLEERELSALSEILSAEGLHPSLSLCLNTDIYDYCLTHHLHRLEVQSV